MGLMQSIRNMADKKGLFGTDRIDDFDDEYEDYDDDGYEEEVKPAKSVRNASDRRPASQASQRRDASYNNKVVRIGANVQSQVVIANPESINEASTICDNVRGNKTVIVNLESINHELAQKIVDFLAGVAYALDAGIESVSNRIFIVAPNSVDISGSIKEELKAGGFSFPLKNSYY